MYTPPPLRGHRSKEVHRSLGLGMGRERKRNHYGRMGVRPQALFVRFTSLTSPLPMASCSNSGHVLVFLAFDYLQLTNCSATINGAFTLRKSKTQWKSTTLVPTWCEHGSTGLVLNENDSVKWRRANSILVAPPHGQFAPIRALGCAQSRRGQQRSGSSSHGRTLATIHVSNFMALQCTHPAIVQLI